MTRVSKMHERKLPGQGYPVVECNEPSTEFDVQVGTVRVLAEDCGGNLALPNMDSPVLCQIATTVI